MPAHYIIIAIIAVFGYIYYHSSTGIPSVPRIVDTIRMTEAEPRVRTRLHRDQAIRFRLSRQTSQHRICYRVEDGHDIEIKYINGTTDYIFRFTEPVREEMNSRHYWLTVHIVPPQSSC